MRILVLLIGLAISAGLSAELDRQRARADQTRTAWQLRAKQLCRFPIEAPATQRSVERLGVVALGSLRAFLSDLLWCQAIDQWMRKDWQLSAATLQAIELLEPRVPEVYISNAWTICYNIAGESLGRGDEASAWRWLCRGLVRLEAGLRNNPRSARLAYHLSFIYFDKGKREPYWSRFQQRGINPVLHAGTLARHAADCSPDNPALLFWLAQMRLAAVGYLIDQQRWPEGLIAVSQAAQALDAAEALLPIVSQDEAPALGFFRWRIHELRGKLPDLRKRLREQGK